MDTIIYIGLPETRKQKLSPHFIINDNISCISCILADEGTMTFMLSSYLIAPTSLVPPWDAYVNLQENLPCNGGSTKKSGKLYYIKIPPEHILYTKTQNRVFQSSAVSKLNYCLEHNDRKSHFHQCYKWKFKSFQPNISVLLQLSAVSVSSRDTCPHLTCYRGLPPKSHESSRFYTIARYIMHASILNKHPRAIVHETEWPC